MYETWLRCDDVIEEHNEFSDPGRAEENFYKLARNRTRYPSFAMATADGEVRLLYHTDELYARNRWEISLDLSTGLPVKRRYIPSTDELTGRKPVKEGVLLPPMLIPQDLMARLQDKAHQTGRKIQDIRLDAYRKIVNEDDTILSEIVGE